MTEKNSPTIVLVTTGPSTALHQQMLLSALGADHSEYQVCSIELTGDSSPLLPPSGKQKNDGQPTRGDSSILSRAALIIPLIGAIDTTTNVTETGSSGMTDRETVILPDNLVQTIDAALSGNIPVIAVFTGNSRVHGNSSSIQQPQHLQQQIQQLQQIQHLQRQTKVAGSRLWVLRDDYLEHDIALLTRLTLAATNTDLSKSSQCHAYPVAPLKPGGSVALDSQALDKTLVDVIPDWQISTDDSNGAGVEITRELRFRSFEAAIQYMHHVAAGCDIANHHPRWQNNWKTLQIWLTTWDANQQITERDVQLARYFDHVYKTFGYAPQA